jgi:pilus assembly protein CpaF
MFEIIVKNELGATLSTESCAVDSCTIGRSSKNFISLKGWRIAGIHAELTNKNGGIYLTDRSGGIGTRVNGQKITTYGPLAGEDVFVVGSYRLSVAEKQARAGNTTPSPVEIKLESELGAVELEAIGGGKVDKVQPQLGVLPPALDNPVSPLMEVSENKFIWHHRIHKRLMEVMDLRRVDIDSLNEKELATKVEGLIHDIIEKMDHELPADIDRKMIATEVLNEAVALGPLEAFLADEKITEIMVNRYDDIYYESGGKLKRSAVTFSSNEAVLAVIDRIVSPLGRRIDESSPMVDGRLKDGSRINAIIPPLATKGPCLTIRKFSKRKLTSDDLVQFGAVSEEMMGFLEVAVLNRKNIIVSGGTGSGKTTFLNVLSNYIPHNERIITVEDSAELQLSQPHTVTLEARPANMEGKGVVSIRDLVKNCLRMRPDRIIVGECRGGETLDMLQAMNTGHDGSLTTVHANSPRDLISRLEVMTMMAGMDLPERAIREQVASAVHMVVQQSRFSDGTRKVTHISEITGLESGVVQMQHIFIYKQNGLDEDGMVVGDFQATGRVPEFYEDLRQRGLKVDMKIFG